jgi:hypothetical protein
MEYYSNGEAKQEIQPIPSKGVTSKAEQKKKRELLWKTRDGRGPNGMKLGIT